MGACHLGGAHSLDELAIGRRDERGVGEASVATLEEHERRLGMGDPEISDFADDEKVVAQLLHGVDRAVDPRDRSVDNGTPGRGRRPADAVEGLSGGGREPSAQRLLLGSQHVHAEGARRRDPRVAS